MVGRCNEIWVSPKDDKIHWFPEAYAIQYVDANKFMCTHGGGSWNSIGKTFFLTREECLEAWGDKPMITDPPETECEEPENLNELVIWHCSDMEILTITVNGILINLEEDLIWQHCSEWEIPCDPYYGDYLTLADISHQLSGKIPKDGLGIIEVRIEEPLNGVIYQYGNYRDNKWREYGKLMGYA